MQSTYGGSFAGLSVGGSCRPLKPRWYHEKAKPTLNDRLGKKAHFRSVLGTLPVPLQHFFFKRRQRCGCKEWVGFTPTCVQPTYCWAAARASAQQENRTTNQCSRSALDECAARNYWDACRTSNSWKHAQNTTCLFSKQSSGESSVPRSQNLLLSRACPVMMCTLTSLCLHFFRLLSRKMST